MVADQLVEKKRRIEYINAHARQRFRWLARHGGGMGWFFGKIGDTPVLVYAEDAKGARLFQGNLDACDRHVRRFFDVVGQQLSIIHLVNMVPTQDQNVFRVMPPKDIDILIHRIGSPLVPGFLYPLLRWQQFDELLKAAVKKAPAMLDMADQALRLVLRGHAYPANAGIDAVGKGKIDNPEFAAKRHSRFGPPVRKLPQAAASPPGQYERHGIARDMAVKT